MGVDGVGEGGGGDGVGAGWSGERRNLFRTPSGSEEWLATLEPPLFPSAFLVFLKAFYMSDNINKVDIAQRSPISF
jgi:hypothetical protein